MRNRKPLFALLLFSVLACGCSHAVVARTSTARAVREASESSDIQLTRCVRDALANDPDLSEEARSVAIAIHDGVVTLRGNVYTPEERECIERDARSVWGVGSIDNRIAVNP